GLQGDGAVMRGDRLIEQPQMQQRVAEIGKRHCKAWLESERLFIGRPRFLVTLQLEQRLSEIGMRFSRSRLDRNRADENQRGLVESPAIGRRYAQKMQGVEMIGQVLQYLAAKRLNIAVPPLAICLDRGRKQRFRLLPCLLLQPCVLEGTRTDAVLQLQFSEGLSHRDGRQDSRWVVAGWRMRS